MANRRQCIARAREAYRLWLTRAVRAPGFNLMGENGQDCYSYRSDYIVYLNQSGKLIKVEKNT